MKKIFGLLLTVLILGLLAACGTADNNDASEEKKKLTMATSADFKPFEFKDTANSNEIVGFDIDLAKALAEKTGYELEIKDMEFSSLIPALQSNQADLVLAGMTPDEKRKKAVDFSDIYYTSKNMIVTTKDSNIKTIEDLEGKTVGVQLGSIQEGLAKDLAKNVDFKIENRDKVPDLIQEMKAGRFDAAIIEDHVASTYFEVEDKLTGFGVEGESADEIGSAIAFPKGSELREPFNEALNEMKENGELEELLLKWFG